MSRLPGGTPRSEGRRRSSSGRTLHVRADLRLAVTAPDGRKAAVRVRDDGGTLRVELPGAADVRVVLASLPGGLGSVRGLARQVARLVGGAVPLPPWDQPVEVAVGTSVVLRRRAGRWSVARGRPGPAPLAVAGALVAAGAVVALAAARRSRGR